MSNRAYKVIKVKLKDSSTLNVGKNFDWLESIAHFKTFNEDGECREMEFFKDDIANALEYLKGEEEKVAVLKAILADFSEGDDDYVSYHCF